MWLPLLAIALVCSAQDAGYYQYQNAGSSHQAGLYGYGHHRIQVSGSQDGYASSPPQDRYGASSFEDRYSVSSSSEDRYGVSSSEDTYGVSSSSEARYGVSSSEDRYGVSSSEDRKGVSSSKDRYGMSSSEDRYGVSSSEDRYGVSSSEDRYGVSSSEDRYGVSSSEDRYGVSSSEDSYASSTSATEEKAFLVAGSRSCSGTEVEWQECRDMPTCNHCVPQNCEFAQWGKWYDAGGCTGLCFRHRALAQPNNECGRPCSGVQEDTKPCFKRECGRKPEEDAMFGSWSEWGLCDSGQRDRHREVATQAAHGGRSVEGPLREVQPCGQGHVVDCEMNQWNAWTTCSCTCGQGWHTRDRRIIRFSANGGKPCVGSTREEHPCNEQPCNGLACQFSPWSSWAGCDGYRPFQRDRHRRVEQPGSNGAGCSGTTHEMEGCTSHGPSDCVISQWDQWSSCDKHCDGGQQVRHRKLIHPAHSGGTCPQSKMKQIRGCNTQSCHSNQNDCILSPWRSWSACTAQCEDGVRKREREVLQRAGEGGRGCSGVMMQVVSCTGPGCGEQDCQWGPWDSWSGCSCSCGGGTKRRNRQVQVSPKGGGELCDPVDKSEAAPCNQHRCFEHCTDARWSEWKQWSECSASCGYGFKFRHRSHQVQANSCGRPATGRGQEWDVCEGSGVGSAVCGDRDGRLSAWNEWSDCSCTCFGIRERQRIVEQYHFGNGKPIPFAPLKQIQPCHPGPRELAPSECVHHHADCKLSQWNEWTECPVTCGGGNKMRLRYIFTPASNNGRPCEAALRETTPCATNPCGEGCVDCLWGHWSEWGACSKCGDQRFRQRDIMKLANHCGKRCEARDAKEVSNCTSQCDSMSFCVWKPWTSWSGCSADCGPATRLRERSLGLVQNKPYEYLFKVAHDSYAGLCAGTQTDTEACPTRPCDNRCVPTDCTFSPWGEWHQPSCIGLCTRSRSISVVNNECGEPCHGPLVATKRCLEECTEVLDCEFRSWSHWSQMDRSGPGALRYRSREVSQMPRNGGKPCEGDIREVDSFCEENDHLQHCRLIPWSDWVSCSKTCGGGWQLRTRAVAQPARNGGQPCQGDLSEGQTCAEFPCQEGDCVLAPWSSWGDCWGGQRTRSRRVEREATAGGRPCGGPGSPVLLGETRPCSQHGMDCQVSAWSAWDSCDKSCGGGEQQRHRQVQVYPMHGGLPCPTSLRELRACGSYSCGTVDCEATAWTEWGACSVQCGAGQQQRDRQIARSAQGEGRKCNFILSETRACRHTGGGSMPGCGMVNCLWGDWSSWSGCTCSCGGGQRTRNRHIAQSPQGGGGRCEAKHKEEIGPCNTHSCAETACRDGAWGEWQEWSPCSASCTGGLRYRHRRMEHEANECGRPAEGFSRDVAPCNQNVPCAGDVNCQFDSWTQWSACTRTCDGIKRRSRRIAVHGRGRGEWCVGATKETSPCAPSPGAPAPIACQPVHARDCIISQWSSWGQCDVTCGGGQSMRERSVDHEARGGGTPCMGSLTETRGCHNQECHHEGPRRDCRWGEWSQWGACNKCGGQRERFRHVLHEALNGGRPCELGAAEETGRCPRKCHEAMYCIWSQWESWSDCSMSCGTGGIRHRQRALALKTEAEVHALGLLYEVNESLASPRLPSQGAQFQMIAAFAGGIMATMVLLHLPQSLRAWFAERDHIPTSQIELAEPQGFLSRWWAHREAQNDGYLPVSTAVGSDLDA